MPAGRPRKYGVEMTPLSLSLPRPTVEYLREVAAEERLSVNELVYAYISNSDKDAALAFIKKLSELERKISELTQSNLAAAEKTAQAAREMNSINISLRGKLYEPLDADENVSEFMKQVQEHEINLVEDIDKQAERLFVRFTNFMLMKNFEIKRHKQAFLLIKKELLARIEQKKKAQTHQLQELTPEEKEQRARWEATREERKRAMLEWKQSTEAKKLELARERYLIKEPNEEE